MHKINPSCPDHKSALNLTAGDHIVQAGGKVCFTVERQQTISLMVFFFHIQDCMLKGPCDSELKKKKKNPFHSSTPAAAVAPGIMFSGHPILVNAISQEHLEGISSNLAQTST